MYTLKHFRLLHRQINMWNVVQEICKFVHYYYYFKGVRDHTNIDTNIELKIRGN